MKKFKNKYFVLTIAIVAILSFALGSYADSLVETITASLAKDVKITYDGEEYVARDVNKNVIYPINYNGSTYLPVRAIANLYGSDVTWDNATRTVGLWSPNYVSGSEDGYIPETELNDTIKNANDFELGSKMKGTVGEEFADTGQIDEFDYFKFVLSEPGIVNFTVHADHESQLEFELRGISSGYEEKYDDREITDNDTIVYDQALDAGTYYFCLVPRNGKVNYKIESSFEPIDNPGDTNNGELELSGSFPSLDTFVKGTLYGYVEDGYIDDIDYYKFNEPLNSITIELNHTGKSHMKVTIYNTQGQTLEYYDTEEGKLNVTYEPEESFGQIGYISIEGWELSYQFYNIKINN